MWLQNLLFLGTVVCSISAPTSLPRPVTRPSRHVDAIQEALSLLNKSSDETAVMVSEGVQDVPGPPCWPGLALPVSLIKWYFSFLQNESVKVVSGMFDRQVRCFSPTHLPLYLGGGSISEGLSQGCQSTFSPVSWLPGGALRRPPALLLWHSREFH